jgi:excisionase family DNA binding protein
MLKRTPPEGMITYQEAANRLGVSKRTIQRYVANGTIPSHVVRKIGGFCYIDEQKLRDFVNGNGGE